MDTKESKQQSYFNPEDADNWTNERAKEVNASISEKISDTDYPCVGAKAAFNSSQYRLGIYGRMAEDATTQQLAEDLKKYSAETMAAESEYMTLIAVFTDEATTELEFEKKLWQQLQQLHNSEQGGKPWDPAVSSNPEDDNFSFSFNSTAFFIVGLHPNASRKARRMSYTAMAFNLHRQFEQLREKGVYENMKKVIREREIAYDGAINPMLNDFGDGPEAPQYSGRKVEENWKCPFHAGLTHQNKKDNNG
ncbi:guanitoxin biosynthesis heme-dependent pre-guanitoxin N-hydroxylase GntA [Pontibacter chitinilyticus]|uniref:guanitoxin biosynthesis heme-dependent pre-guanitoxin N-hydroxylase GntA n=1 Tax=Pontibacter chitinilyticus TaxID=2674989 RepID=UPI00321B6ED1